MPLVREEGIFYVSYTNPMLMSWAFQAGIRTAKQNITIASLYAGTSGGLESQFVDALQCAASKQAHEAPSIKILLDALRSTRPSPGPQGRDIFLTYMK